ADLYGRRRAFAAGLSVFTLASVGCLLSGSQASLVAARAVQGVGGALITAAGPALVVTLFFSPPGPARAVGVYSFVAAGGGALGVILGGVLTQLAGWRSIFVVNVPVGAALLLAVTRVLEPEQRRSFSRAQLAALRLFRIRELVVANVLAVVLR